VEATGFEMDQDAARQSESSPAKLYSDRLRELHQAQTIEQKQEKLFGFAKVSLAFLTLLAAVIFIHQPIVIEALLVPVILFAGLAIAHEHRLRSIRLRQRNIHFYERGLARLEDRWAGTGETGERFLNPEHPYARDLDLFGRASLFELLCTARTRVGEETLAAWLLAPAPVEEILARQEAVNDLKTRVEFRERLFSLGETVRLGVHPEVLSSWGVRAPVFPSRTTRVMTSMLAILWILGIISWGVWGLGTLALAVTVLNLAWAHRLHERLEESSDALENASKDLQLLAGVLALVESEHFSSPKLVEKQAYLKIGDTAPSDAIKKLARIVNYLESRRNPAMRLLDVLTFWSAQFVFAAERWQTEFGPQIRSWLAAVGELEALTALAGYSFERGDDVFPEFLPHGPLFNAEGIAHPLLPLKDTVRNDVMLGDRLQLIVLSGPNMAGKSTFIRAVGVNAVLAQCGAPVRARRLRLSPLNVAASICVLDSLSGGVSRFYAEIHRLKLATDLTRGLLPVLFLLDELLSGTNSHDRLAGTQLVVKSLMDHGAIGIVSTHDLALTKIPEQMIERAINRHFEDQFNEGKLVFDYKLKQGIVKSSNALELMRSIGLGTED
jgi:MutS domain V